MFSASCRRFALPALLLFFAYILPAAALPIEIDTALGKTRIEKQPATIAVFDIAAIDTLYELGVPIAGIPDNLFVPQLSELRTRATIVGTLFEPDLEALSALQPEMVIVGGRSSPKRNATERVAPTIDMTIEGADLLGDARKRIAAYGDLFAKRAEAEKLLSGLDAAAAQARSAASGKGRALIVMTNGPKISVFGERSRFGWIHRDLGIETALADDKASIHGDAVSFEFIRDANPDWLIVIDRSAAIGSGEANAEATLDNELVASTIAWTKGQVIYLPAADAYIAAGGAAATMRVMTEITAAFSANR